MKTIFLFSVCCLAVAFAGKVDFNAYRTEQDAKATAECTAEFIEAGKDVADTGSNKGCFDACRYKKMKIFNDDGTLNFREISERPNKEFEEHAQRVYTKCLETGNGDPCKVAYCIAHTKEF